MTPQAFNQLINQGEGCNLGFKTSFGREAIESVAAFANSKGGGVLLVGVTDNGTIAGVNCSEESIQSYANQIKNATEPSLIVDVVAVSFESKKLLYIKVNEYPVKPVSCKGKHFKRVENSNHQMNLTEIANMHLQSLQLSWDAYEAYEFSIEKYGSGYIRIRDEISAYSGMKLDFEEMGNGYLVTLSYETSEGVIIPTTQKTTREKVLELLEANNKLTRNDLAVELGVSDNAIKQHLANLQAEQKLQRVGGRKEGYWLVMKNSVADK